MKNNPFKQKNGTKVAVYPGKQL